MVDILQPHRTRLLVFAFVTVARQKRPVIIRAVDEGVDRIAVGRDRRQLDRSVLVFQVVGLVDAPRSALRGLFPGLPGVVHPERHIAHAVSVAMHVVGNFAVRAQRRREHEADLALLQHIRSPVAQSGLRTGVGHQLHAEGEPVKIRGLARIADVELDIIRAVEGKEIFLGCNFRMKQGRHTEQLQIDSMRIIAGTPRLCFRAYQRLITIYPSQNIWPIPLGCDGDTSSAASTGRKRSHFPNQH